MALRSHVLVAFFCWFTLFYTTEGFHGYISVSGPTCSPGYEPITSSWQHCKAAAQLLGINGDHIDHVDYPLESSAVPQGCCRSGLNKRVHFNTGPGGNAKDGDSIICKRSRDIICKLSDSGKFLGRTLCILLGYSCWEER